MQFTQPTLAVARPRSDHAVQNERRWYDTIPRRHLLESNKSYKYLGIKGHLRLQCNPTPFSTSCLYFRKSALAQYSSSALNMQQAGNSYPPYGPYQLGPPYRGSIPPIDPLVPKDQYVSPPISAVYPSSLPGSQSQGQYSRPITPALVPETRHRIHILRFWKWEVLAIILAACAMAAIIFLLVYFDGERVPEWPYTINLTTLVSVIATIFKAALLAVIGEIISQAKWSWFRKSHAVNDLQRFDEASRSGWGALKFFLTIPKTFIGTIAAAVILISMAIGPFSQQAIKSVTCQQANPSAIASVPITNFAAGGTFRFGAGQWRLTPDFQGALVDGLTAPLSNVSIPTLSAACTTGNCTFPSYAGVTHSTMGLCSACVDLTNHITLIPGTKTNYTLPGGPFVDASDAGGTSSPILNVQPNTLKWLPQSSLEPHNAAFSSSAINMTMIALTRFSQGTNITISSPYSLEWHPFAVTCAIHPCLRNYHGAVSNNILNETLLSTVPAIPAAEGEFSSNGFHSSTALRTSCLIDGNLYTPSNFSLVPRTRTIPGPSKYGPDTVSLPRLFEGVLAPDGHTNVTAPYECIYKLYWVLYFALYYFFTDYLFTGSCFRSADAPEATLNCPDQVFWLNSFWENGNASMHTVQKTVDGFVKAATDRMRAEGGSMYNGRVPGEELPFEKLVVKGVGLDTTVCVEFDKWWLALPVGLLALGAFLLVVVVLDGYLDVDENGEGRQPVWKSSLLPLMYCGFLGGVGTPWRSVPEEDELEKLAKKEKAVLSVGGGSVGFIRAMA